MTKIADLANEIAKQIQAYTNDVKNDIEIAEVEIAKEAVRVLRQTSPKRRGKYARGWRLKKVGKTTIIHNATHYQLTHLLEHGHVNRDGSRTQGIPHIRPAEEKAVKDYVERVERAVRE